jgi:hypothetical protein
MNKSEAISRMHDSQIPTKRGKFAMSRMFENYMFSNVVLTEDPSKRLADTTESQLDTITEVERFDKSKAKSEPAAPDPEPLREPERTMEEDARPAQLKCVKCLQVHRKIGRGERISTRTRLTEMLNCKLQYAPRLDFRLCSALESGDWSKASKYLDAGIGLVYVVYEDDSSVLRIAIEHNAPLYLIRSMLYSRRLNPNRRSFPDKLRPGEFAGGTVFSHAVRHNAHPDVLDLLVEFNADMDLRDYKTWSALDYAWFDPTVSVATLVALLKLTGTIKWKGVSPDGDSGDSYENYLLAITDLKKLLPEKRQLALERGATPKEPSENPEQTAPNSLGRGVLYVVHRLEPKEEGSEEESVVESPSDHLEWATI